MARLLVFSFCLISIFPRGAFATVYYVDKGISVSGNGSSWATATRELRDLLSSVTFSTGDEIHVAGSTGTYTYTPAASSGSRGASFALKNGVKLIGGYQAGGSTPTPNTYITVLSGDLNSNDSATCSDTSNWGDNSYQVVTAGSGITHSNTTLSGFTITHGIANGTPTTGGGINLASGTHLVIQDCKIVCNRCDDNGAGLYAGSGCVLTISGSAFHDNTSQGSGAGAYLDDCRSEFASCTFQNCVGAVGGGIAAVLGERLYVDTCHFSYCDGLDGGGIFANTVTDVRLRTNCTFDHNTADRDGGAFYGIHCNSLIVEDSNFSINTANSSGGAIYNVDSGNSCRISGSTFEGNDVPSGTGGAIASLSTNVKIRSCSFLLANPADPNSGNHAGADGGAVYINSGASGGNPAVINCTFIGNTSDGVGGGVYNAVGGFRVVDCSFFSNASSGYGGAFYSTNVCEIHNSVVAWNRAVLGAGMYFLTAGSAIKDTTISENIAGTNGGGIYNVGNTLDIKNSILWRNWIGTPPSLTLNQVGLQSGAGYTAYYSDVQGGVSGHDGGNNVSSNPRFADSVNYNFRLIKCSPLIDKGSDSLVPFDVEDADGLNGDGETSFDRDITTRIIDFPGIAGSSVDIGAYELDVPGSTCSLQGDLNGDTNVNGLDIQGFTNCVINVASVADAGCVCGDMNNDFFVTMADVPCFATLLLTGTDPCSNSCVSLRTGAEDCNENGEPDELDVLYGYSLDCNWNGVPDECDIAAETSADVNGNGVPDECEPDCNGNNIPDAWDISEATSIDVNSNDIPDECDPDCNGNETPDDYDIAELISPDCNENGMPDECEPDCNENGVPDDCDIDPTDPDGDAWVSEDCNENEMPDECDLELPPGFGSLDCNENGIPDECDIVSEYSADANENGIPDECEESQGFGEGAQYYGGEGGETVSPCASLSEEECWEVFWDWAVAQCWGPDCEESGFEQYQALVDKLVELGLPLENLTH